MGGQYFLFCDIETGGLNGRLENGMLGMEWYPIFELAFIVTDDDLQPLGSPLEIVVHQSEHFIKRSHEWALKTHAQSGLLTRVRESNISLKQAEQRIIAYLKALDVQAYNSEEKTGPVLAGNSIMLDRSFIMCQMPELHGYLHYRQVDISSFALAARAWLPELEEKAVSKKTYQHEALADIKESIEEFKTYRDVLFQHNG